MTAVGHEVAADLGGQYRSKNCSAGDWEYGVLDYICTYDVGVEWMPMAYITVSPTGNYGWEYTSYGE